MPQPGATEQHYNPYKNFRFRVRWEGRLIAGISRVGALRRTTEVTKHSEGGDPGTSRKSPGRTESEAIILERGLTQDTEFVDWANQVWRVSGGPGGTLSGDFRKDIVIEVYNEAGELALAFKVHRCWVSEYQALPELDANGNAIAIEQIKLENEGWERLQDVAAPGESTAATSAR